MKTVKILFLVLIIISLGATVIFGISEMKNLSIFCLIFCSICTILRFPIFGNAAKILGGWRWDDWFGKFMITLIIVGIFSCLAIFLSIIFGWK